MISKEDFDRLQGRLSGRKNPVEVVPEIIVEPSWSYEEAAQLGLEGFAPEIKDSFERIQKYFSL